MLHYATQCYEEIKSILEFKISVFYFPRFRVFIGPYSKARKRKRGNSFPKSLLLGSSVIQKNRRGLSLLIPFYLVLSENYNFRDFRGFRVFDLAQEFVDFPHEEVTIPNIIDACNKHLKMSESAEERDDL